MIVFAAVVFLGPERLPELARFAGKLAGDVRRATRSFTDVRDEFTKNMDPREMLKENVAGTKAPRERPGRAAGRDADEVAALRARRAEANVANDSDAANDSGAETSGASPEQAGAETELPEGGVAKREAAEKSFPPPNPRYGADREADWMRERLLALGAAQGVALEQPAESAPADDTSGLPEIRPANARVAQGVDAPREVSPDASTTPDDKEDA